MISMTANCGPLPKSAAPNGYTTSIEFSCDPDGAYAIRVSLRNPHDGCCFINVDLTQIAHGLPGLVELTPYSVTVTDAADIPEASQNRRFQPIARRTKDGTSFPLDLKRGLHIIKGRMIVHSGSTVIAGGSTFYFPDVYSELRANGALNFTGTAPTIGTDTDKGLLMLEKISGGSNDAKKQEYIFNGSKAEMEPLRAALLGAAAEPRAFACLIKRHPSRLIQSGDPINETLETRLPHNLCAGALFAKCHLLPDLALSVRLPCGHESAISEADDDLSTEGSLSRWFAVCSRRVAPA